MSDEVEKIIDGMEVARQTMVALKKGMIRSEIIDASGKVVGHFEASPDLLRAFDTLRENKERDDDIKNRRDNAVDEEIAAIGDEVLDIDTVVEMKGGLKGIVTQISRGYRERPYYRVFLENGEGTYGDPHDESNYAFLYSRDLKNYGRRI